MSVADVLVIVGSLAILAGMYREVKQAEQGEPERVPVPVRTDDGDEPRE